MATVADLSAWALNALGLSDVPVAIIAETPWSYVLRIDTQPQPHYLKHTPPALYIEAAIIKALRAPCGLTALPDVVAEDASRHCFLMTACGDHSLRTHFNGTLDVDLMVQGLQVYRELQTATQPHINHFIQLGVPDWRLEKLAQIYHDLAHDDALMVAQGLSGEEIAALQASIPTCTKLCDELAAFNLPATLSHSDLHDNNMLLDVSTKQVSLIDLGETAIEHPLLSLACCLSRLRWRYKLEANGPTDFALRQACYAHTPPRAVALAEALAPLSFALGNWRLLNVAGPDALQQVPHMQGRLRNCLLEVLKSFNTASMM